MSIVRLLLLVTLSVGGPFAKASVSPWIDFQIVEGFVVIPTEVHGIKGHSVIDTGSQVTGIAHDFVERNELDLLRTRGIKITGVNKTEVRPVYQDIPVTLMGSETVFSKVVDLNLGPRPQMLIGGDFLRTLYFQFDYPNRRLRAISRNAFDLKKLSNVPSKLDPGTKSPMAKIRLNDEKDVWLTIDTGNSSGIITKRAIAKKRQWLATYDAEPLAVVGAIGSGAMEIFRLPLLSIGPYNVRNARVVVEAEGARPAIFKKTRGAGSRRVKSQGLLGFDVLKNFLVTFDYRTGAMFIELPEEAAPK